MAQLVAARVLQAGPPPRGREDLIQAPGGQRLPAVRTLEHQEDPVGADGRRPFGVQVSRHRGRNDKEDHLNNMHERSGQTAAPGAVRLPGPRSRPPPPIFSCSAPARGGRPPLPNSGPLEHHHWPARCREPDHPRLPAGRQADGEQAGRKTALQMPLKGSLRQSQSSVLCSNNVHDLGGAMGIRTPDLLHAMNHSAVP